MDADFTNVNLLAIGAKRQSKQEIYREQIVEGGMYLPPEKETPMQFISQIAVGVRK